MPRERFGITRDTGDKILKLNDKSNFVYPIERPYVSNAPSLRPLSDEMERGGVEGALALGNRIENLKPKGR